MGLWLPSGREYWNYRISGYKYEMWNYQLHRYIIVIRINRIDNMRTNVNRKTHPSTHMMVSEKSLVAHVIVVVAGGSAKISRSVPDRHVTMPWSAEHTQFARVRAMTTPTTLKDHCYVIIQARWIVNIAVAPRYFSYSVTPYEMLTCCLAPGTERLWGWLNKIHAITKQHNSRAEAAQPSK